MVISLSTTFSHSQTPRMMRPSVGDKCYSISIDSFTIREMTKFRADCVIFTTAAADTFIPSSPTWESDE